MKFTIKKKKIIKALQQINNLLSNKPILPILYNFLLKIEKETLFIIGTDLEVEIIAKINLNKTYKNNSITVSGRKLFNIFRGFSDDSNITVHMKNENLIIQSNNTRFSLSTLSSDNFPNTNKLIKEKKIKIPQNKLKYLIEKTQFSMANQDVRYYLNGILLETKKKKIKSIATNGHRLAISYLYVDQDLPTHSIIIPRKGVIEIYKLLEMNDKLLKLQISDKNIKIYVENFIFTSKLLDGEFPEYKNVIPKNTNKILKVNRNQLKEALLRASILSNEKFKGFKLCLSKNKLKIIAKNPEQEKLEEIINAQYNDKNIEIGLNIDYILDVLNVLTCEIIKISIKDSDSSIKIENIKNKKNSYIIMPMRL